MNKTKQYRLTWCLSLLGLFVFLPFLLSLLGFSRVLTLSFTISVVAILSDGFLTKAGLKLKCSELNPFFILFRGKIKVDYMLVASRIVGIIALAIVVTAFAAKRKD